MVRRVRLATTGPPRWLPSGRDRCFEQPPGAPQAVANRCDKHSQSVLGLPGARPGCTRPRAAGAGGGRAGRTPVAANASLRRVARRAAAFAPTSERRLRGYRTRAGTGCRARARGGASARSARPASPVRSAARADRCRGARGPGADRARPKRSWRSGVQGSGRPRFVVPPTTRTSSDGTSRPVTVTVAFWPRTATAGFSLN